MNCRVPEAKIASLEIFAAVNSCFTVTRRIRVQLCWQWLCAQVELRRKLRNPEATAFASDERPMRGRRWWDGAGFCALCGLIRLSDLDEKGNSLGVLGTGFLSCGKEVDDPKKVTEREDQRMTNGRREKYWIHLRATVSSFEEESKLHSRHELWNSWEDVGVCNIFQSTALMCEMAVPLYLACKCHPTDRDE